MIIKVCEARQSARVGAAGALPPRRSSDSNLGRSMGGLVRYLVGPGKANEHTEPTVVAASEPLDVEFGDVDFTSDWAAADTRALVEQLNKLMRDRRARDDLPADRGFVFHAVMSLPPGQRADHDLWGSMARDYVRLMGFDGSENKAPCRWVAVHHGQSTEGNDHIHVAVMMIRDDGTWASNGNSKRRSMAARKEITAKYGLVAAEDVAQRRDRVPYASDDIYAKRIISPDGTVQLDRRPTPSSAPQIAPDAAPQTEAERAEVGAAAWPVPREPDNDKLRRVMTAAAGQAETEADYIKTLWRHGVLTRPRYAEGTRDVVTGYSVALRRGDDQRSQWRAAGTVHKSLRLSALRERWSDAPTAASDATATWRTFRGETVPMPTPLPAARLAADAAAGNIRQLNDQLAGLDRTDVAAWSAVSADVAAALAQASVRHEPDRYGPLGQATEALLRDAQHPPAQHDPAMQAPVQPPRHTGLARSVRLMAQASSPHDTLGWIAVLEQLSHTIAAIAEARRAQQLAKQATYLATRTEAALVQARAELFEVAPSAAQTALNTPPSTQPGRGGELGRPALLQPHQARPDGRSSPER